MSSRRGGYSAIVSPRTPDSGDSVQQELRQVRQQIAELSELQSQKEGVAGIERGAAAVHSPAEIAAEERAPGEAQKIQRLKTSIHHLSHEALSKGVRTEDVQAAMQALIYQSSSETPKDKLGLKQQEIGRQITEAVTLENYILANQLEQLKVRLDAIDLHSDAEVDRVLAILCVKGATRPGEKGVTRPDIALAAIDGKGPGHFDTVRQSRACAAIRNVFATEEDSQEAKLRKKIQKVLDEQNEVRGAMLAAAGERKFIQAARLKRLHTAIKVKVAQHQRALKKMKEDDSCSNTEAEILTSDDAEVLMVEPGRQVVPAEVERQFSSAFASVACKRLFNIRLKKTGQLFPCETLRDGVRLIQRAAPLADLTARDKDGKDTIINVHGLPETNGTVSVHVHFNGDSAAAAKCIQAMTKHESLATSCYWWWDNPADQDTVPREQFDLVLKAAQPWKASLFLGGEIEDVGDELEDTRCATVLEHMWQLMDQNKTGVRSDPTPANIIWCALI